MDKVTYINPSSGEAARAIMNVLMPQPHPFDGPFLRKDLKNASKAGEHFGSALARLMRAGYVDELQVVTYELVVGRDSREPLPENLTELQLDIIHVLRLDTEWMWYDLNYIFDSAVPYSEMLKLVSRGIVKSRMNVAYETSTYIFKV